VIGKQLQILNDLERSTYHKSVNLSQNRLYA